MVRCQAYVPGVVSGISFSCSIGCQAYVPGVVLKCQAYGSGVVLTCQVSGIWNWPL